MFRRKRDGHAATLSFIGRGTELEGTLRVEGSLRVDGVLRGVVIVKGDLEVNRSGRIEGPEVYARNILLSGEIRGRVMVEDKLSLSKQARLEGDVIANALDIEAGAVSIGSSKTGSEVKALPVSVETEAADVEWKKLHQTQEA